MHFAAAKFRWRASSSIVTPPRTPALLKKQTHGRLSGGGKCLCFVWSPTNPLVVYDFPPALSRLLNEWTGRQEPDDSFPFLWSDFSLFG